MPHRSDMAVCERCGWELRQPQPPPELLAWIADRRRLSPTLRRALVVLWQRGRDAPVSREVMMRLLYDHCADPPYEAVIRQHMYTLRGWLRGSGAHITYSRNEGWQLVAPPALANPSRQLR
jgi:hypothetical protein